jgi:hypothetical protein
MQAALVLIIGPAVPDQVFDAILIPAGKVGYQLCESSCGTRFGGHSPAHIAVGLALTNVGGTLRAIGRIRY